MQPLASPGTSRLQSNTNLSRSVALSLFDSDGRELATTTDQDHRIEMMIPRDPNVVIPPMALQNVTFADASPNRQLFNLHFVNITSQLPISLHLEMRPLNPNIAYLFVYRFDSAPQLNSTTNLIDGWTAFCPLRGESVHTYFLDNQQTLGHQSIIFGLRELNATEITDACFSFSAANKRLPIVDARLNFTANYELRLFTSGCYYLDAQNQWQGEGLVVGPMTNHNRTQCLSTHLTTFAGGFIVLPAPVNWKYVFANADFAKNKTIYITLMVVCVLYVLLVIFARRKDNKDLQKVRRGQDEGCVSLTSRCCSWE